MEEYQQKKLPTLYDFVFFLQFGKINENGKYVQKNGKRKPEHVNLAIGARNAQQRIMKLEKRIENTYQHNSKTNKKKI